MTIKGIMGAVAAIPLLTHGPVNAANRVEVHSTTVLASECSSGQIAISIENDVDLHSVSIPLVVRSLMGMPGYWTSLELRPSVGRLATSLNGIQLIEQGRADFVSPDHVVLYFEATDENDCLPAGTSEFMTGITFRNNGLEGLLEIDTSMSPPCYTPGFSTCTGQQPIGWDEFVPGYITLFALPGSPCDNVTTSIDSTIVHGWSGATLSNDADYINVTGDAMRFRLVSGPGEVDSLTGNWNWMSSPSESGQFAVNIATYLRDCPSTQCMPVTFTADLRQLVPADINCDGVVNVLDVVREIGHTFRSEPAPIPCWDL